MKPKFIIVSFEPIGPSEGRAIGKITYGLSNYLHGQDYDVKYYVINKGRFTTSFPSESVHWLTRYLLYALNLVFKINIFKSSFRRNLEEWLFDNFLAHKDLEGDYLLTTSPFISRTLKKHSHKFKKVVFLPANPNETEIAAIYRKELSEFAAKKSYDDAYYNKYREQLFRKSLPYIQHIIAISDITLKSYLPEKIPASLIPYVFIPQKTPVTKVDAKDKTKVTFLYVAHSVPLKGLHRLLKEWKAANLTNAELNIVGGIVSNYSSAFDLSGQDNVHFLGPIFPPTKQLMECDVVVIPSLIDNEPTTAIESLQYKKPVLISTGCGYAGLIADYVPEAVFDIYEEGQLAAKLKDFATNLKMYQKKFEPAFTYVSNNKFNLEAFYEKIIATVIA